jgi:nondiscriminating aspartyl-tRNA synthetase
MRSGREVSAPTHRARPSRRCIALAQSAATSACRSWLAERNFVEVVTPQLTPFAVEDAGRAFPVSYLDGIAYLGQSRRRYHQILLASHPRVFEIGPIFWADPVADGRALTQYTAIEFGRVHLREAAGADDFRELVELVSAMTTAVDTVLPIRVSMPVPVEDRTLAAPGVATDAVLRAHARSAVDGSQWWRCTGLARVDGPFPVSDGAQHALVCGDRVIGVTTWHRGNADTLAREVTSTCPDADRVAGFVEGFQFGMPDHVTHIVILEHLLASLLDRPDLREIALFPRDAEITWP